MKEIKLFYLEHCPYCVNARKALDALLKEKPEYREIGIDWVEESRQRALADSYDYYNVPTVFYGNRKLYEARPGHSYEAIRENRDRALQTVLSEG